MTTLNGLDFINKEHVPVYTLILYTFAEVTLDLHLVLAHPIIVVLRWSTNCTKIVNLLIAKRKSKSWLKFILNHKIDGSIR